MTTEFPQLPAYRLARNWRERPYFLSPADGDYDRQHFQGREDQIQELANIFRSSAGGGTVLVSGNRGVGKTATVDMALIRTAEEIKEENQTRQDRRNSGAFDNSAPKEVLTELRPMDLVVIKLDYASIASDTKSSERDGAKSGDRESGDHARANSQAEDSGTAARVPQLPFVDPLEVLTQVIKGLYQHFLGSRSGWVHAEVEKREGDLRAASWEMYGFISERGWWRARLTRFDTPFWRLFSYIIPLLRSGRLERRFNRPLVSKLEQAMLRALSVRYEEIYTQGTQNTVQRTLDARLAVQASALLALVGASVFGVFQLDSAWPLAAPVVGMIAMTLNLGFSRRSSSSSSVDVAYAKDNSIPTLKRDVEEILGLLESHEAPREFRVVVILDELDKLQHKGMLDQIIENFKNLFTLNKAVFVFITDKDYYEYLEELQLQALRDEHTYAVHHTFFTHRVFLTRPGFEAVTQFLDSINDTFKESTSSFSSAEEREDWLDSSEWLESDESKRMKQVYLYLRFESRCHFFDLLNIISRLVADEPETLGGNIDSSESGGRHQVLTIPPDRHRPFRFQNTVRCEEMVELVFGQERFDVTTREYLNDNLLAQLYSVFDTSDTEGFTRWQVISAIMKAHGFEPKIPEGEVSDALLLQAQIKAEKLAENDFVLTRLIRATDVLLDLLEACNALRRELAEADGDDAATNETPRVSYVWRPDWEWIEVSPGAIRRPQEDLLFEALNEYRVRFEKLQTLLT